MMNQVHAIRRAMRAFCLIGVASLCLQMPACQAPDTAPSAGLGDEYPAPLNDPTISVLSPELREWIRFQRPIVIHEEGKPFAVEIPARNVTYNPYNIEYRVLFFDKNDRQISPEMGWAFVHMDPKEVVRLRANELGSVAQSYRLQIRWSR